MKSYERRLECWQCLRCDHLWQKRPGDRPVTCPSCKNKLWAVTPTRKPGAGRKKKVTATISSDKLSENFKKEISNFIVDVTSRPIPHEGEQNATE